jgi:hypothetical protein
LHKLEEYPDTLNDFYDPEDKLFKLTWHYKLGKDGHLMTMIISRKKDWAAVSS